MIPDAAIFTRPPLTKIIATVGPASSDPECVQKLIEAGVSIFRLNFGHGTVEDRANQVRTIGRVAAELKQPTAILGDVQGPKIRVGQIEGKIEVEPGDTVIIQREPVIARSDQRPLRLSCTYPGLIDDVEPGQRVLIADGAVRLLIIGKRADEIECSVTAGGGGTISSAKGINLPDTHINAPVLDEADWRDVSWAIEHDLDFLAMSFVRSADDLRLLRQGLKGAPLRLVAKIELPEAVQNIDSIVEEADGIMIARGDLGVEMDLARVPVIQKEVLKIARAYGKPCIVATQMLESMIHSPSPTRAEANDVADAILDGTDAVMLSGETAVGRYPVVAVESMRRIAHYTEQYMAEQPQVPAPPSKLKESRYRTAALAHGVWHIAHDIGAKFIAVWSQQGGGARYLSQNDFSLPIIACTSDERAARQMQLLRSVTPVLMNVPPGVPEFTRAVDHWLRERAWGEPGDLVVLMAGTPIGTPGVTNAIAVHTLGNGQTSKSRNV